MKKQWVYLNGEIVDEREAHLPVSDRGLLFGDGLFETVLAHRGSLLHFADHAARLRRSLERFRIGTVDSAAIAAAAGELLRENELAGGTAKVKVVVTRGNAGRPGLPSANTPSILITASSWTRPAEPWSLLADSSMACPPLARHKSLNYLHQLDCRQRAFDDGYDDALLFTEDGEVCESTIASLLVLSGGTWLSAASDRRLPSISERYVLFHLRGKGLHTERRPILPADLESADAAMLCSALMIAHPVGRINDRVLPFDSGQLAAELRSSYIQEALVTM